MNLHEYLDQLSIPSGHTKRMDCPVCSRRNTFSVSNKLGVLVYNCYSAACKVGGAQRTSVTLGDIQQSLGERRKELIPFSIPPYFILIPIERFQDYAALRPCVAAAKKGYLNVYKDVREQRLVFPVRVYGTSNWVDATGRSLVVGNKPKWKRYAKSEYPFICGKPGNDTVVIVEDCISASAVAGTDRYTGVAIMGTSIHSGYTEWIKQFQRVIVALDYDAANKGLDYTSRLSWLLPTHTAVIKKDLKEYSQEQILEILDNV